MKKSKQSSSKSSHNKIAAASFTAYSYPSELPQNSSGKMMERLPSTSESEVERIFRNWDIGKRCKH